MVWGVPIGVPQIIFVLSANMENSAIRSIGFEFFLYLCRIVFENSTRIWSI